MANISCIIGPALIAPACARRGSRMNRRNTLIIHCSQEESKNIFPFDFSSLQDIPSADVHNIRRTASYNARRRRIENRGVPQIYPQVYGQATKIEKLWKDWKSVLKDSYSRGLEYLTPESDPEDEVIMETDGLWIEKKYPDVKFTPVVITRNGEILK